MRHAGQILVKFVSWVRAGCAAMARVESSIAAPTVSLRATLPPTSEKKTVQA
jgi:hypothetical protein